MSLWHLAARVAGKQRFCLDWDPTTRLDHAESKIGNSSCGGGREGWESVCDFEPSQIRYLRTNFGATANTCVIFRLEWVGKKPVLGQMA
ncbi:hypothetical protein AVEN_44341-1 [Araneus ventricosus]|uniref:Uncharacterized protein n=1 Tax=Araneus ventricosus TaxID=182803 RepID=A0A4Y2KI83_ARAVE|nr:hypothetical protein AVEN_44341-1 [Araneus ventricosus]